MIIFAYAARYNLSCIDTTLVCARRSACNALRNVVEHVYRATQCVARRCLKWMSKIESPSCVDLMKQTIASKWRRSIHPPGRETMGFAPALPCQADRARHGGARHVLDDVEHNRERGKSQLFDS